MQLRAEKLLDLSRESAATRRMYGLDQAVTANFGTRCLMARRLVEEGVRFVQVHVPILGNGMPWDQHNGLKDRLRKVCPQVDRPSAALIRDLKQRGLLDSTVVLWTGEFGRLPISQHGDGRDHNRHAFALLLAGGGVKAGHVHGATRRTGIVSQGGWPPRPTLTTLSPVEPSTTPDREGDPMRSLVERNHSRVDGDNRTEGDRVVKVLPCYVGRCDSAPHPMTRTCAGVSVLSAQRTLSCPRSSMWPTHDLVHRRPCGRRIGDDTTPGPRVCPRATACLFGTARPRPTGEDGSRQRL
jgi:hypothetical protein